MFIYTYICEVLRTLSQTFRLGLNCRVSLRIEVSPRRVVTGSHSVHRQDVSVATIWFWESKALGALACSTRKAGERWLYRQLVLRTAETREHTLLCGERGGGHTNERWRDLLKYLFESGLFPNLWQVNTKTSHKMGHSQKLFVGATQFTSSSGEKTAR